MSGKAQRMVNLGSRPLAGAVLLLLGAVAAGAEEVTFSRDVAPIFFGKCVQCHRPGEVAPMSLLSYSEARPWAKSIARVVAAGEMPPWSGESDRHRFSNDISLTAREKTVIGAWVRQGAKVGDPADLPERPTFPEGWTLGEPDMVVALADVEVPAEGEDLFLKQSLTLDLDQTRWVRAIEFLPGDRRATHHFQVTYSSPGRESSRRLGEEHTARQGEGGSGVFGIWTAGMPPYVFPEGVGRVLTPGTRILVDSHYHPFGEATSDATKIGVYFGEGELQKEVATVPVANTGIRIPPGAPAHAEQGFFVADEDLQILAFSPHMHVRGKAMTYQLTTPAGETETLLDVPDYDYNWQWLYYPTEPIDVPAGSRIDVTAVWDNSEANPANPDPSQEVIYRGDTFNEMFVGFLELIRKDGVFHQPRKNTEKLADLIAAHPSEASFLVKGFMPLAFYAPREGEGILYLVQDLTMFTITLDDIQWDGEQVTINTQFPTPEASATTTLIRGEIQSDGKLKATLSIGADTDRPFELPVLAVPAAALSSAASGAGE